MCGEEGVPRVVRENTANNLACEHCNATLRYRAQASAIVSHFGSGQYASLKEARAAGVLDNLAVWEMALRGPIRRQFFGIEGYVPSYYWPDLPLGATRDGVVCQDVTALTFADSSFDLVISSDVMEHVHEPWAGFAEIARVLKPGGMNVFTIPVRIPLKPESVTRATLDTDTGEVTHILPEVYHQSGELEPSLVFTDFGADIFERHRELGMHLSFHRASTRSRADSRFGTFVAVKLG